MPRTLLAILLSLSCTAAHAVPVPGEPATEHEDHGTAPPIEQGTSQADCVNGVSSGYPCRNIGMLARLTLEDLGGAQGTDSWGWQDPSSGRRYALMGLDNGIAFVEVTDPALPVVVGRLASVNDSTSPWRDVKTHAGHAFVVADAIDDHGMQVFDLSRLASAEVPETFAPDAHYQGFGSAHNVAINEATGFAYAVGTNTCDGGLHMVDIRDPLFPANAGCFEDDGYTHDVHCVTWVGPDAAYQGRELCFGSNTDSLTIVDVTDKEAPFLVGKADYPALGYTHQGWLSDDHRYFLVGDELDESDLGMNVRTLVFDVSNPDAPVYAGAHLGSNNTTDHNLYLRGRFVYQANYSAGVRILLAENLAHAELREVAYFDTRPALDRRGFEGAWNVYPFFDDGLLLVSDMQGGLFVLRAALPEAEAAPINGRLSGAFVSPGLNDQGFSLFVGENIHGPYAYFAWHLFRDGEPFWLSGAKGFEYGADHVDIPTQRLQGLDFLEPGGETAERVDVGTLHLHAHGCNLLHLEYDFGPDLGAGELDMHRLLSVQGHACAP